MFGSTSTVHIEQGKVNLCLFNISSDLRLILRSILAPARLVTRSCVSAPRNNCEAGISSMFINRQKWDKYSLIAHFQKYSLIVHFQK